MSTCTTLPERLIDLLGSHRVTATICAAVDLGVVEALSAGPQTPTMVATACSAHEAATERLLTALLALGICERVEPAKFQLSKMGAHLGASSHCSLRDWAVFEGGMLARSWLGLSDSIRSGKTSGELLSAEGGRYEELRRDPKSASVFDAAMTSMTRLVAQDVLRAYDFSAAGKVLDVGGGAGTMLIEILRAHPTAKGCVLDLPRCEMSARQAIANADLALRAGFVAADFFMGLPQGFDTLVLKSILHNWDDARCAVLLAHCQRALAPSGRLLIVERFLTPDCDAPARFASTALSDLNMLRGPGGRERGELAYRNLVSDAGLSVTCVRPAGRYDLLIAEAG
jgi:ubiquinone/menaquinone biosynthesis C-methylase UbiE